MSLATVHGYAVSATPVALATVLGVAAPYPVARSSSTTPEPTRSTCSA
jgi:hypothetical protein